VDNFSWLNAFKEMGTRVRDSVLDMIGSDRAGEKIGEGASGDTTSAVDKVAEDAIVSVLNEASSAGETFKFISEELGERDFGGGELVIIADPIDGSNNAKTGMPYFSTSVALASGSRIADVTLGYIINISTGEEFWAVKGEGAFRNGVRLGLAKSARTGMMSFECRNLSRDLPPAMSVMSSFRKVRLMGSIALDLAYLASGSTDLVYVASPSRSFDFAAGWLLVKEAGGVITDMEGSPLDEIPLGLTRTIPILAAADNDIHSRALKAMKAA